MRSLLDTIRTVFSPSAEAGTTQAGPQKPGQHLLDQLDAKTRSVHGEHTVFLTGRNPLAVNPDGLMRVGGKGANGRELDGTQVSKGASVMAAPQRRADANAFIEACVNHQITHVIDLAGDNVVSGRLSRKMHPWGEELGGQKRLHFRPAELAVGASGLPDTATNRQVRLVLEEPGAERTQQLSWTRLDHEHGDWIDPKSLLAVCQQIRGHERMVPTGPQDAKVAFMDDNGGDTAAAFAAAHAMFRLNDRTPLTASDVEAEVIRNCALLRSVRSSDLFSGRPDIMDSLKQFAQLMIEQGTTLPSRFNQEESLPRETPQRTVRFGADVQITRYDADEMIKDADVEKESRILSFREDRATLLSRKELARSAKGDFPNPRPTRFQHSVTRQQLARDNVADFRVVDERLQQAGAAFREVDGDKA
jgi:hypothetical protein